MPKIPYIEKRFNAKARATIEQANSIIAEYQAAGLVLTLRQLYYQFVARDLIPNTMKSYKALGNTINDARLAGLIDWNALEDRTRNVHARSHWDNPAGVIRSSAASYGLDLWEGQEKRVEVWIEKDALVGVIERPCDELDVPYFSCRGYTSQSELWRGAQRHIGYGVPVVVIHLGDHDPSGKDMTRDIEERLQLFGADSTIERIALNIDQVNRWKLPPNPAKITDSRFAAYAAEFGESSWELDALDPRKIDKMVRVAIESHLDRDVFDEREAKQETDRDLLNKCSKHWADVATDLEDKDD